MKRIITVFAAMFLICLMTCQYCPAQRITIAHIDTTTMTAPGISTAVYTGSGLYSRVVWDFIIANINTTVAVVLQKKTGNGNWTGVWADSLVYTKNGNFSLEWYNVGVSDSLRFRWLTESGGTAATIKHSAKLIGGN